MPTASGRPSMMDAILAGESIKFQIGDKDTAFKDPVKSPITKQHYTTRRSYEEHVHSNGCFIVGDDTPKEKPKGLVGDFNVREELSQATHQVLNQQ